MTLKLDIKDINGKDIEIGSRVYAYAQNYTETLLDEINGVEIIEIDITKPRPIADVPLFIGQVIWNSEELAFEIRVEKILADWEIKPAYIRMGGGMYAYELSE